MSGAPEPSCSLPVRNVGPAEDRVGAAERDEAAGERVQLARPLVELPVDPAELVVLAVGVVVAVLGAADLVAGHQHRHAVGEEQRREEVARCRSRSAFTAGSSVSPSTPQFQERLSVVPSWLSSRFASLCRSL